MPSTFGGLSLFPVRPDCQYIASLSQPREADLLVEGPDLRQVWYLKDCNAAVLSL
jgi:hypothetical protein